MKAALFYEPGVVRYTDAPDPRVGVGEVLVRIGSALTCGTDVKCFRRGHPVLLKDLPSPFGHEFAGTVTQVGEGVTRFQPGDRVVAANSAPCYDCFYCHQDQHNLCENLNLLNGAYAESLKIPAGISLHNTHHLPPHVSFEAAAFCEPLAVCLRGVELSGIGEGHRVAILGLGSIGQLLVKVAKWKGAHVTAMARNEMKLDVAQRFGGADAVVNLRDVTDAQEIRRRWTPGALGFDVVIEAIGLPETWLQALALVRRGGTVNFFGGCASGTTVPLDTRRIHYDEIRLLSLFHHTPVFFKQALDLIASGDIDPLPLITDRLPMAEVVTALQRVEAGEALKIALTP